MARGPASSYRREERGRDGTAVSRSHVPPQGRGPQLMSLIEGYLHRQLRGPTLQATLALSGVAILSESLSAIGLVLNQRQSPLVFAKVIVLAMPQLIVLVLPVAV